MQSHFSLTPLTEASLRTWDPDRFSKLKPTPPALDVRSGYSAAAKWLEERS